MTPYEQELSHLDSTLLHAAQVDISGLKTAISGASEASIIAIGSGGSFTVASLLCSLHEAYTGHVSRAVTPLELICNPTLASASPIFVVSAEGKNPDVLEALERARKYGSRAVHVITNRADSPLMDRVKSLKDVSAQIFDLVDKDGYLATNSLALDASLVARAYGELDQASIADPLTTNSIRLADQTLKEWLADARTFVHQVIGRSGLIIVYSPRLKPLAEDLESKFSEAALLSTQLCDFRSFAHGRHLWLTERSGDTALLLLTEPSTDLLWNDMQPQIPQAVPRFALKLAGSTPRDLIGGLVAAMYLVSEVANVEGRDIARPQISPLGRRLYYADLSKLIPPPIEPELFGEDSKYQVLGAHWPTARASGKTRRALTAAHLLFEGKSFRSIVFDYDGTLCSSSSADLPPSDEVIDAITRLLEAGVIVGIASGRGGSIGENLESKIDEALWPKVRLGLYNGGWIGQLGQKPTTGLPLSEFLINAKRIVTNLRSYGVPITNIRPNPPYQLSVRFEAGVSTENMWFAIVDALKQAGLETGTVVRSKHSVDILSPGVSKSLLIARIIQDDHIDPYEVVTMGDLGAWPGNDFSLLQHRYSLSVDIPSRRLDRGWKLTPRYMRDVDAALWYLARLTIADDGTFNFNLPQAAT
jgi:HAD superfamily hydrolase (TIGR01484 family)